MFYTGIGSRAENISSEMAIIQQKIASKLANAGLILRSGHASGSDHNFELGSGSVNGVSHIYLPWAGFRNFENLKTSNYFLLNDKSFKWARNQLIKSGVLPYFDSMNDMSKAFHTRNVFQILGKERIKSNFVVYYSPLGPVGEVLGGTRTAVNLATKLGIPTFNLKYEEGVSGFVAYCDKVLGLNIDWE